MSILFFLWGFCICSRFNDVNYGAWYVYKPLFGSSVATCRLACSETSLSIIGKTRTSCIYFLPKIHKPNNPGRPHRLCLQLSHRIYFQLFDIYRQKFTIIHQRQPTFAIFREFNIFSQNKLTFSVNITSLYTVITIDERFPKALLRNLALKHY